VDGIKLVADELAKANFDIIIVDEFTQFKNAKSQRWKCLASMICAHTRVWMLSGTPAPQGPCDAYGPVKLIAPHRVPRYFTAWQEMVMRKITAFKYVPRDNATTLVHEAMQPAIRFAKKDCLDLPPLMYQTVDVEMTPQQEKYYNQMKRDMMVATAGTAVTAVNAASRLVKLLQIAMGAVNADADETVMHFDIAHRLNVVQDLIEAAAGKVLIAVPYLNALHRLHEELSKDYTCEVVYGAVSSNKRTEIFRRFQSSPDPQILIIQPSAAAHGVTLTEADTIIWFGPTTSFEVFEQFNGRIDRPGQTRKMTAYLLQSSPAERHLNLAIQNLRNGHVDLTDMYRAILDT
jgi:SNF2 family DNA or RNA helicase